MWRRDQTPLRPCRIPKIFAVAHACVNGCEVWCADHVEGAVSFTAATRVTGRACRPIILLRLSTPGSWQGWLTCTFFRVTLLAVTMHSVNLLLSICLTSPRPSRRLAGNDTHIHMCPQTLSPSLLVNQCRKARISGDAFLDSEPKTRDFQ